MTKLCRFAILVCYAAALASCTKEERDPCLQPRTTLLRAHTVRHDTSGAQVDTLLPNPLLLPLSPGGIKYQYGGVRRTAFLSFSLSNVDSSCAWIVRPDSAFFLQDTLTFFYDRQLRFLSNSCGYTYFYNIQRITTTTNLIDSAILLRPDVTTDVNIENLRLVF